MSFPPAIFLDMVSVSRGGKEVLKNLSAKIASSQLTAVIGPNGAGKTTLFLAMLGIIPYSGSISFLDSQDRPFSPRISYVPQTISIDRGSCIRVFEFMALDQQMMPVWIGVSPENRANCFEALSRLKAEYLIDRPLGRLSGGEIQRVLLAKALQRKPDLLLLDEPVSGVDIVGGHLFCDVLEEIRNEQKITVVMVSHDLSVVSRHANRVLCINQHLACEGETPIMMTSENLMKIYGIHSGLYAHHSKEGSKGCDSHPGHDH